MLARRLKTASKTQNTLPYKLTLVLGATATDMQAQGATASYFQFDIDKCHRIIITLTASFNLDSITSLTIAT